MRECIRLEAGAVVRETQEAEGGMVRWENREAEGEYLGYLEVVAVEGCGVAII